MVAVPAIVAASGVVTFVTMRLIVALAGKALLDMPNARSSHAVPTPKGGGLGVLVGLGVGAWLVPAFPVRSVLGPLLCIAMLSLMDDLRPLSPRFRLVGHIAIAALVLATLGEFRRIAVPPFGTLVMPAILVACTMLWLVGVTNVYNFLDGIDGLAGVQAVVGGVAWWWIGARHDLPLTAALGSVVAAAAAGFLPFNWSPARIFLGDVGSASLGLAFAMLPLVASREGAAWAAPVGVLLLWPFLFDATLTVIRRLRRGERVTEAHRSHLYQRLVVTGWSHTRTTLLYAACAGLSAVAAVGVAEGVWWWGWAAALATGACVVAVTARAERGAARRAGDQP
jgi:UDP-N-acetylmuramyl pentapeptide phosphotransferase/UDP-N-acetylglucosamine-1-phosphate transferase